MRIGILTTGNQEEDQRFLEAGRARGHDVTLLELLKCSLSICPRYPDIYYEGVSIGKDFDIIIPRIDTGYTQYGLTVLRQFQSMHIFTTDQARALELGRDKLRCVQRLLRDNVPFPSTGFAYSKSDFDNIINTVGGVPLIIKLVEGTEGVGVFLADDMKHAINLLKTFKQLSAPLMVQKFIGESAGTDIRAFVVGDEIVATMRRVSTDGDFRANIALGGESEAIDLTDLEKEITMKAVESGVDLIRSKEGPLVIEINVSPGFSELEDISNIDIAGKMIEYSIQAKQDADEKNALLLQHKSILKHVA